jgi:glycosyltransferase involved in cell wall biosynthesis
MDDAIHDKLYSEGVDHNLISDYKLDFDVELKALDWLKNWSNSKIFHGKNIKELFIHEGISLWWFMELAMFQPFKEFKYSPSLKELIEKMELVKKVIDIENPTKITVTNTENPLNRIIVNFAYSKGLEVDYIKTHNILFKQILWTSLIPIGLDIFVKSRSFLRAFISKLQKNVTKKSKDCTNKILIMSYTLNWRGSKDVMFDNVIKELIKNKENEIVQVDIPTTSLIGVKQIFEKKRISNKVIHKTIEEYPITNENLAKKSIKNIREIYAKNKCTHIFYEDVEISQFIYQQLDLIIHHYGISNYIKYIELIKSIINIENPDVILLIDEYNPIGRATVVAGKVCKVPTIALQHGVFGLTEPGYKHNQNEISIASGDKTHCCPLPDKTAVFGPYYQKLLYDVGNYSKGSVIVTGSPRYDSIINMRDELNSIKIFSQLKLNPDKKLIVYTSQPINKMESDRILSCILKSITNFPNTQLVIKMHPSERLVNKELLAKFDVERVTIIKTIDIYELLNACDVMITPFSTTALEAMILDKPVITLNLTGLPDKIPYAKSGAAIGVCNDDELTPALKSIFEDDDVKQELASKRKDFVCEHAYEMDGFASKRIVEAIDNIIQNEKSL